MHDIGVDPIRYAIAAYWIAAGVIIIIECSGGGGRRGDGYEISGNLEFFIGVVPIEVGTSTEHTAVVELDLGIGTGCAYSG